jgi:type III pantothenate kinase
VAASVLLADVGNSRVKVCLLGGAPIVSFAWREPQARQELRSYVERHAPTHIVLASTAPLADEILTTSVWQGFSIQQITAANLPMPSLAHGTGIDRLLAAWLLFEQNHSAVVSADCGTAFTLDIVDAHGCFHGGAIGAGLAVQEQALQHACPHLAAPVAGTPIIPQTTASAVFAGTSLALAASISALAQRFEQQLGCTALRFLSGGDAARLQTLLPTWQLRDNLVLEALDLWVARAGNGA